MKFKNIFKNKWYIMSFISGIIALGCLVLYSNDRSMMSALAAFVFIAATVFGFYKGRGEPERGATVTTKPPTTGEINCLKIYASKKDDIPYAEKILFENIPEEELIGNRWYFEDTKQWLHVMYNDINEPDKWKEFELTDEKYIHPGRLAWVLNQDDYVDFMSLEPTTFEKLKPLIMIGANALVLFFIFLSNG